MVVVDAPRGVGKTTLGRQIATDLGELACAHRRPIAAVGPELTLSDHAMIVIDDASATDVEAVSHWRLGTDQTVVLLGRCIDAHGANLVLGESDLRFSADELRLLLEPVAPGDVIDISTEMLESSTWGWPVHVDATLRQAADGSLTLADLMQQTSSLPPEMQQLITECLADLDPTTRDALREAAKFEALPVMGLAALFGDALTRCRLAGVPFFNSGPGWVALPPLVREFIRDSSPPDPAFAGLLSPILVAKGGILSAAKALLVANAAEEAASVVCSVTPSKLDDLPLPDLLGLLEVLARQAPRPQLLLRKARVHRSLAQLDQERAAVERAKEMAIEVGDREAGLESEVEMLYLSAGTLDLASSSEAVNKIRAQLEEQEVNSIVSTRLREVEAILASRGEQNDMYASLEIFRQVAAEWEHLGERARAASTLRVLAGGPLNQLGLYRQAIQELQRALALVPDLPFALGLTYEILARFHALTGDQEGFAVAEKRASSLAEALGIRWLQGYVHWARMLGAVVNGNVDDARLSHQRACTSLGQLLAHETGATFHAESAVVFAVLGDKVQAELCLETAMSLTRGSNVDVLLAELAVEVRFGNEGRAAELLDDLRTGGLVPYERWWRFDLEAAVLARRSGDEGAAELEREHREAASEQGLGAIAHLLLSPVGSDRAPEGGGPQSVSLLGRFGFVDAGEEVDVPAGQLATLLKLVSIEPGGTRVEVAIDTLWPSASEALGRRRLKNVVRRIRNIIGDDGLLRVGDRILLADHIESDVALFLDSAARSTALAATEDETAITAAMQALHLYPGDLLPDDLYEDWTHDHRASLRSQALAIFDYVLGRVPHVFVPAVWLLRTADRLGIESDQTYVRIAQHALGQGSEQTARSALLHAKALADELDVPLSGVAGLEDLLPD